MARRKEYNERDVRNGTLQAFLEKGFADTSLSDLESASGLDRRQLYDGLGDKKAMFVLAMQDFSDIAGQQFLKSLEEENANLETIQSVLQTFVDISQSPRGQLGCLICNTSSEAISRDKDVRPVIDIYFRRIESAYLNALTNAARRNEIPTSNTELQKTARLLLGTHVSLCVLGRAGEEQSVLQDIVDRTIKSLS